MKFIEIGLILLVMSVAISIGGVVGLYGEPDARLNILMANFFIVCFAIGLLSSAIGIVLEWRSEKLGK